MGKVTIHDVAREAGVGIGTVSRVMNNSPQVSDETRQLVLDAIKELGYRPNAVARQLPRKNTYRTIGVITRPFTEYYSFSERLRGVQKALHDYRDTFDLALYTTENTRDYDERFYHVIENSILDGLLVIDLLLTDKQRNTLRQLAIPFVGINHYQATDWVCVGTDNKRGGYLATKHLIQLGHERIAYVGNELVDSDDFRTSENRHAGYRKALREANIDINVAYTCLGEMGYDPAFALTSDLLQQEDPPTAIFAMSDTQALGCIAAARELGLRVPEDLSVIGYDDLELSRQVGLSTVRQHLELSGEYGMIYLLQLINGDNPDIPELPALEVIQRATTAKLL